MSTTQARNSRSSIAGNNLFAAATTATTERDRRRRRTAARNTTSMKALLLVMCIFLTPLLLAATTATSTATSTAATTFTTMFTSWTTTTPTATTMFTSTSMTTTTPPSPSMPTDSFSSNGTTTGDGAAEAAIANITEQCLQRCSEEAVTFLDEYGVDCLTGDTSEVCYVSRCHRGCRSWWAALKTGETCTETCASKQFYPYDMPCISACETAQSLHWRTQRTAMAALMEAVKPKLLDDSLGSDALILRWRPALSANVPRHRRLAIEYRENGMVDWAELPNYECAKGFDCNCWKLMPFAVYRFRFLLHFGDDDDDALYSLETEPIQMLASGKPVSKPLFGNCFAMDHSRVAASWLPGVYTSGSITGYQIIVEEPDKNNTIFEKRVSSNVDHYVFDGLAPDKLYRFSVAMTNAEGKGPFADTNVYTSGWEKSPDLLEQMNFVLIGSEYSIRMKRLEEPPIESQVVFDGEELISDYALSMATQRLFVVDATGYIYSLLLSDVAERTRFSWEEKVIEMKPVKLTVDWLNQQLYVAGESVRNTWNIAKMDFEGNFVESLATNLTDPIHQLEVDPINGWLFWTHFSGLSRMNLASGSIIKVLDNVEIGYFTNNCTSFLLTAYNRSDNQFYEISYDGAYRRQVEQLNSSTFAVPGTLQSFTRVNANILATNGTHIVRSNFDTSEHDVWAIGEGKRCWKALPVLKPTHQQLLEPTAPKPRACVRRLQALLTASTAYISWVAPALTHYQTQRAWQRWHYQLDILDVASNSRTVMRNIATTNFTAPQLQPNNLYVVRVCAGLCETPPDRCQAAAPDIQVRTLPMGERKLLWVGDDGGLFETNEIGANAARVAELGVDGVRRMVQLNGTVYFITQDHRLRCANILNPEVNCTFAADNAGCLSYDWRGGKLYWADRLRKCVMRANLDGMERELLPLLGAVDAIEIDAINGHLYYSQEGRVARRALSGSTNPEEQNYRTESDSEPRGTVRAMALDTEYVYLIERVPDGRTVRVDLVAKRKRNINVNLEDYRRTLERDVEPGTLKSLDGMRSLIWLESSDSVTSAVLLRTNDIDESAALMTRPDNANITLIRSKSDFTPFMDLGVIPDAVDPSSIVIDNGYWDDFTIKWTAVTTAANCSIFYSVLLEYPDVHKSLFYTMEVSEPFVRITEFKQPQLLVNVSITTHTVWSTGPSVRKQLRTPPAAPAEPKRLRVFVQRSDEPLQLSANISALIRWDPPENVSLTADVFYKIYCWSDEQLFAEVNTTSDGKTLEAVVGILTMGGTYTFQVQAFPAGRLSGGVKTALHSVYISPEAQSVPRLLYTTSDFIGELDLDLKSNRSVVYTTSQVEHLVTMQAEGRLFWVNENVELMSLVAGVDATPTKLARMRAEVLSLTVDWITRIVYWAELETVAAYVVSIYKLDLNFFDGVMLGTKMFSIGESRFLKDLLVLPFSQTLLWLEHDLGEQNATLAGRNLSDLSALKFNQVAPMVCMFDGFFEADLETVNLVDFAGKTCTFNVQRQICTLLRTHFNDQADTVEDMDNDAGYTYTLQNDTIRAYSGRQQSLNYEMQIEGIRMIKAYSYQPYPKRKCLMPDWEMFTEYSELQIPIVEVLDESFIVLDLPIGRVDEECWLPLAGLKYILTLDDGQNNTRLINSYQSRLNVTQLQPFTNYTMNTTVTTYYQQKFGLAPLQSPKFVVRTAAGSPTAPQNFTAYALNPSEIHVSWADPAQLNSDLVWYQLHWQMSNSDFEAHRTLNETAVTLTRLEPGQEYIIWLMVFSTATKFNTTTRLVVTTCERPSPVQLVASGAYDLTLSWTSTTDNLTGVTLVSRALNAIYGQKEEFSINITHNFTNILVGDLEPKCMYEFYLELTYAADPGRPYNWPELHKERFVFETLGDRPSSPGQPHVEYITGDIFKVFWEPARNNGAPVLEYSLEALQARLPRRMRRDASASTSIAIIVATDPLLGVHNNSSLPALGQVPWAEEPHPIEDTWVQCCNTTELSCIVRDLHTQRLLMFRVRARNDPYGWGPFSEDSEHVSEPFVTPEKRDSLILAILLPAAIVTSCVLALVIVRFVHQRRLKAKKLLDKGCPSIWSNITPLQQQQMMASRHRAFSVASHSTMYTGGPLSDADIALLPHITWNQVTLLNFLGSGAFGEVYEGLLKHDDKSDYEKVAIKSLRKGANEFAELLKEAQLMSNFKHDNIVRLIGVCCDTESISIIMEHMEGGDLLTYLRESRANASKPLASLQMLDLMAMCIDVATGCCYLEDMHFVHRDLACRNCLVSSRVPSRRVVKIGDFGLARDIYKNDYYRKEGEGLLPVRWMSPESLEDGVFTTQSDVWAFAVLCWEILTLGQQPYVARNNFEVLNYVKAGGRLAQPDNCPDKLFQLMLECWHTDPEDRPSFRKCLNTLHTIKTDARRVTTGYNMDDEDNTVYANQHGIVMSTFLANPSLAKVIEEDGDADDVSVKSDLKAHLDDIENDAGDADVQIDTMSDDIQLIDSPAQEGNDRNKSSYVNEAMSRL